LEEIVSVTKIDRRAYELFSSQNKMLLNKYQSEHKETMNSMEEMQKMKFEMKCLTESVELKSQEMISKEMKYEKELRDLRSEFIQTKEDKESLTHQVEILRSQLETTQRLFSEQMELKTDEMRRFKQMEYGNLMKSDLKLIELYQLKDQYEVLQETLSLSNSQSNTLTQRLEDVMGEHNSVNEMLFQFIQQTEVKNHQQRILEMKYTKENESLQNEILILKKSLRELCERNETLEKEFEQEKLRNVLERDYSEEKGNHHRRVQHHSVSHSVRRSQKKLKAGGGRGGTGTGTEHNWSLLTSGLGGDSLATASYVLGPERDESFLDSVKSAAETNDLLPSIHTSSRPSSSSNGNGKVTSATSGRRNKGKSESSSGPLLPSRGAFSSSLDQRSYDQLHDQDHDLALERGVAITGKDLEHSFCESSTSQILEKYDHDRSLYTSSSSGDPHPQSLSQSQSQTLGYSAVDAFQYQGKRCLLAKYLRHLVTVMNTLSIPPSLKLSSLDLSRSSLTDLDMIQVIDWFRLISIREINLVDFRYNLLTSQAMTYLATWILSLDHKDLIDRTEPLQLLCQYNLVCLLLLSTFTSPPLSFVLCRAVPVSLFVRLIL
jgi:hypothetical protein